jgi:hypothetical protein
MDNPFALPLLLVGLASGIAAGLIPSRTRLRRVIRMSIVAAGAGVSWLLQIQSVQWSYSHPFNSNDGAALTMVALLGWLVALIWPILPALLFTLAVRLLYLATRRKYGREV